MLEGQKQGKKVYNVLALATEDGERQYYLQRTKDVRPGQVKMESLKMETCHMAKHCRE